MYLATYLQHGSLSPVFSLSCVDLSTSAFVSKAEVRPIFIIHYEYYTNYPT